MGCWQSSMRFVVIQNMMGSHKNMMTYHQNMMIFHQNMMIHYQNMMMIIIIRVIVIISSSIIIIMVTMITRLALLLSDQTGERLLDNRTLSTPFKQGSMFSPSSTKKMTIMIIKMIITIIMTITTIIIREAISVHMTPHLTHLTRLSAAEGLGHNLMAGLR